MADKDMTMADLVKLIPNKGDKVVINGYEAEMIDPDISYDLEW